MLQGFLDIEKARWFRIKTIVLIWKRQAILIQFYTWGAPAEKWGALLAFWGAFDKAEKILCQPN